MCKILPISLLCVQALLLIYISWHASPNRTEAGHIAAAVYFWHTREFDVFHVNPPLTRIVAGLPVKLFCNPKHDWDTYSPRPQDRCEWLLGNAFISANDPDDLKRYVFVMRLACIPFVLLGGYFGYLFAYELYGQYSGIAFLALWTFSPLILGWGATLCPDAAAASVGIFGVYTFWHWLKKPSTRNTVFAGIGLGLMPLVKMTWIIAFPIWCILFIIWKFSKNPGVPALSYTRFAALFVAACYVINAGYLFDDTMKPLKEYQFISGTLTGNETVKNRPIKLGNRFADSWLGSLPVPLPAEFVQGIDTQKIDFEQGFDSYARGIWADHGWRWYYAYVLLLKEPLGIWGLTFLALFVSFRFRQNTIPLRDELMLLIPLFTVFVFLSSQTGFSIHARYMLPIMPLLYIFISKAASASSTFRLLSVVCIVWMAGSSLWCYPNSLSYFNELAGKPTDYPKYLLGSNIDWGQDSYTLQAWIKKHPEATPLYVSFNAPVSLEKLGVANAGPVPSEPTSGWMAVSVNVLFAKEGKLDWLKNYEPVSKAGYSVWIYHITL